MLTFFFLLSCYRRSVGAPVTTSTSSKGGSVCCLFCCQTIQKRQKTKQNSQTEEENEAELKNYDAKVYKASVDMARAMDAELRNLGIPFFAIKPSLVVPDEQKNNNGNKKDKEVRAGEDRSHPSLGLSSAVGTAAERKDTSTTTISRTELLTLQRRMLELLQDLCKD